MTGAVLDRPGRPLDRAAAADRAAVDRAAVDRAAAPLDDARGGEHARGRDHARGGDHVTLEERLAEALRAAHATGSAECPACGGAMVPTSAGAGADAAACGDCGSRLS